jgi:hypothetical protein
VRYHSETYAWSRLHATIHDGYAYLRNATAFDMAERVAALDLIAPAGLQGFAPLLSNSLETALPQSGRSRFQEAENLLNDQGMATDYAELVSGFARSGILERERLARIGAALGSRYALLPGLAGFDQEVMDGFDVMGLKVVRNIACMATALGHENGTQSLGIDRRGDRCYRTPQCAGIARST